MNLFNGNCLDKIKDLDDNSVDCIITDPPYGMSFMGKDWDKALPDPSIFKECYRVLKDGAFAFVMSAPRSDLQARMSIMLEGCGFDIGYTPIYWTFASGFPKGMNVSKSIESKIKCGNGSPQGIRKTWQGDDYKPIEWEDYKKGKMFDNNTDKDEYKCEYETKEAKKFDGSYAGFQPKPAIEVIIVAMKPLTEKTFVDQALKNGKGVTWFNDCRIPHSVPQKLTKRGTRKAQVFTTKNCGFKSENTSIASPSLLGRFPANLLVSDDVLNDGINKKTHGGGKASFGGTFGNNKNVTDKTAMDKFKGDSGSFSRYFNLDVWWNKKLQELPENVFKTFPFLLVPKASKSEKNKGLEINSNIHPTVKPIKLMSYLVTLGSREGDIVLDPFMGSGTTGIASEILNRDFIGCEWDNDYFKIAEERIKANKKMEIKSVFEW